MVRINLLPTRKGKRREASQQQLLLMFIAVLVAVGGTVFHYLQKSGELEQVKRTTRVLQAELDQLKSELGDYDKIKAQREELLRQRESIKKLELGRTGPVFLLREMSEILTPGKGPTFDRVSYEETLRRDPNAGFNAGWDTRRLWIESFQEQERQVRIKGAAKSNEDAAEFLKRLNLSVFFSQVSLENTSQANATKSAGGGEIKHINFSLTAGVHY